MNTVVAKAEYYSLRLKRLLVLVYTHEVISISAFAKEKPFRIDLIDISKREFAPAILFYLNHALFTP